MEPLFGIAYITADGELLKSMPGARLTLGGKKRSAVVGHSLYGFSSSFEPARLEFEITVAKEETINKLKEAVDQTVKFEGDNGTAWVIANAFVENTGDISHSEENTTASFIFVGDPAESLT
ncbi:MAG: phage tail tube protein [Alphaproteobacteria bacterium]|nr:phage tail tube protein [Alphaproteobacteria bacterium]MDD9919780.1 phage tail tube protein [Alphaproteobacteria bacterium]